MNEVNLETAKIKFGQEWLSAADLTQRIQEKMTSGDMKFAHLALALETLNKALESSHRLQVKIALTKEQYEKLKALGGGDDRECLRKAVAAFVGSSEPVTSATAPMRPIPPSGSGAEKKTAADEAEKSKTDAKKPESPKEAAEEKKPAKAAAQDSKAKSASQDSKTKAAGQGSKTKTAVQESTAPNASADKADSKRDIAVENAEDKGAPEPPARKPEDTAKSIFRCAKCKTAFEIPATGEVTDIHCPKCGTPARTGSEEQSKKRYQDHFLG